MTLHFNVEVFRRADARLCAPRASLRAGRRARPPWRAWSRFPLDPSARLFCCDIDAAEEEEEEVGVNTDWARALFSSYSSRKSTSVRAAQNAPGEFFTLPFFLCRDKHVFLLDVCDFLVCICSWPDMLLKTQYLSVSVIFLSVQVIILKIKWILWVRCGKTNNRPAEVTQS